MVGFPAGAITTTEMARDGIVHRRAALVDELALLNKQLIRSDRQCRRKSRRRPHSRCLLERAHVADELLLEPY